MKTTHFLRISLLFAVVFLGLNAHAQSKKEIVQKGIEIKRIYKQDVKDGEKELYIEKEEFYNVKGELVEMKEYSDNGTKIKNWFQYEYDADGNLTIETEFNSKGEIKEKIVTKYENGLKVLREFYDDKDRLKEKRTYEYEYRK